MSSEARLPPELREKLLAAALRASSPTRDGAARRHAAYVAAGFAWTALLAALLGVHLGARPPGFLALLLSTWVLVAAVATAALVRRGRSMLGRSRGALLTALLATPLAMLVTLAIAYAAYPEAAALDCGGTGHVVCFVTCLVMAAGPAAAFAALRRGADPVHPGVTAAAIAGGAAAWASMASILHCPYSGLVHLVLAHVLPLAAAAALGALILGRVVALRAR